ncbi:alpha/beta fold hydrolase [Streptomyces sp. NPDC059605]|uniref:alpha/beta fold hydrolase n=1 Tax=unclassified Streptomyces TaxID=2593676 RepID=UPI00367790FD
MPTFSAPDGTRLAYRAHGDGPPLVCVPGGPADSRYLGDLGGLAAHRRTIVLDLRGTGRSAIPDDASSYRCDRLVDDIEALRDHLGLARMDLLGHSAGTNIAVRYAAEHPDRVGGLVLIGPSVRAVGLTVTGEMRRKAALLRKDEPWFPPAFAALEALVAGTGAGTGTGAGSGAGTGTGTGTGTGAGSGTKAGTGGGWEAVAPFLYGRWDAAARRHHADGRPDNEEAVARFGADGAFDPEATRAALAALGSPVLLLTGEFDLNSPPRSTAEYAELFLDASFVVQPGAGHFPWLDDADRFVTTVTGFLG